MENDFMEDKLLGLKEVELKNGEVLKLINPTVDYAERIVNYLNIVGGESDNLLFGKNEFHLSVEQEKEYIKNLSNRKDVFIVIGVINNEVVSLAQIRKLGRKRIAHNSEIAISVKKDFWGIGVGSAVIGELIEIARNNNILNISLGVKSSNSKAINLYKKFGFEKVGVHKNYFNINGVFDDEIVMDLYL